LETESTAVARSTANATVTKKQQQQQQHQILFFGFDSRKLNVCSDVVINSWLVYKT